MCVIGVYAILTTYHLPGFQLFLGKVVSSDYIIIFSNAL